METRAVVLIFLLNIFSFGKSEYQKSHQHYTGGYGKTVHAVATSPVIRFPVQYHNPHEAKSYDIPEGEQYDHFFKYFKNFQDDIGNYGQGPKDEEPAEEETSLVQPREVIYTDPTTWPCRFKYCRGENQSPINIDTKAIVIDPSLAPLIFENYGKRLFGLTIFNSGDAVNIEIPDDAGIFLSGATLKGKYRLKHIYITWSKDINRGSMHTVDSKYFTLEIDLFHLNTKYQKYVNKPDAAATIHTLVKITKYDNPQLEPLIKSLRKIIIPDVRAKINSPLVPSDFLADDKSHFVTYKGSDITPPCFHAYTRFIFHKPIYIGINQRKQFIPLNRIKAGEEEPRPSIEKYIRPVQALGDRKMLHPLHQDL